MTKFLMLEPLPCQRRGSCREWNDNTRTTLRMSKNTHPKKKHSVERGKGRPKGRDEDKRWEVWECDGWVYECESIGLPWRDGDVTLELWWIQKLRNLKHEYPSCAA
jgi:hypothetical protein